MQHVALRCNTLCCVARGRTKYNADGSVALDQECRLRPDPPPDQLKPTRKRLLVKDTKVSAAVNTDRSHSGTRARAIRGMRA